ncbi:hypothetical protein [Riemerella columbina]|uniref:hypothetical protein n=1 Tax=Riemerella columbina TaxID=103810 RepID=UPI000364EE61|nr:hypothetical protein [Riemerella columbina]
MANIAKNTETKQGFKFLEALKAKEGDWYIIETRGQNGCSVVDREIVLDGVGSLFFDAFLFYKSTYDYDYTRGRVFNEAREYKQIQVNITYVEDTEYDVICLDKKEKEAIEKYIAETLEVQILD